MLPSFEHVGQAYELTLQARAKGAPLRLDFDSARRLLAAPMSHATGMRRLREALSARASGSAVSRMTDAEVVHTLAHGIASRRIHLYATPVRRLLVVPRAEAPVEEALGPVREAQEEEAVDDAVDVPAQVEVLLLAAKDGVPFCEECEKARLAELAEQEALAEQGAPDDVPAPAPAPAPYDAVDVPAQVAALTQASAAGVPFCAECEKARLAELAANQPDEQKEEQEQDTADTEEREEASGPASAPAPAASKLDAPAQAAVLAQAAASGAPFCEECEKARLAEQASATNGGGAS
ncbi:MAG TPA: hypothetical protein VIF09_00425 [Polyangiaceae bacterium]|jgi:hypothetical protein